jgi:hypothetical protein
MMSRSAQRRAIAFSKSKFAKYLSPMIGNEFSRDSFLPCCGLVRVDANGYRARQAANPITYLGLLARELLIRVTTPSHCRFSAAG